MTFLYRKLASLLLAIRNCEQSGNKVWQDKHRATIDALIKKHMPSGSGFDSGTKLHFSSSPEKLVFKTSFHHMNDAGSYDGWTSHTITVKPSLVHGFTLSIGGKNRNSIKDLINEMFQDSLHTEVE